MTTTDPQGGERPAEALPNTLIGYTLIANTIQAGAFAWAGTPVALISLESTDPTTQPITVSAHITVTGTWPFTLTGAIATATAPNPEKVSWTVHVEQLAPVYAPLPVAAAPARAK